MAGWGSQVEIERRRRIRLAVWAYAYEFQADSMVSDGEYDQESKAVDLALDTGNETMDKFFREKFDTDTGQWIHDHPELDKIAYLYLFIRAPEKLVRRKRKRGRRK